MTELAVEVDTIPVVVTVAENSLPGVLSIETKVEVIEIKENVGVINIQSPSTISLGVVEQKVLNVAIGNIATNAESAKTIIAAYRASEPIAPLQIVRIINDTDIAIARNNGMEEEALAIGIALNGGLVGDTIPVQFFGRVEDPFFSFPANALLFLGNNGNLTMFYGNPDEYRVAVAQSLGAGAIFINIKEPIQI